MVILRERAEKFLDGVQEEKKAAMSRRDARRKRTGVYQMSDEQRERRKAREKEMSILRKGFKKARDKMTLDVDLDEARQLLLRTTPSNILHVPFHRINGSERA